MSTLADGHRPHTKKAQFVFGHENIRFAASLLGFEAARLEVAGT
jgi:hypothetical protein